MNRVILAYSRLPRQLPAPLRMRWRARLGAGRALHLSVDALAQSRTIAGVALACRLLSDAAGRPVSPAELRYSACGQPHAPGLPQFSIAHEGPWILCALASAGAVGVDLEPLVRAEQLPRWSAVFDAAECSAARTPRAALGIWTAKEAALKAAGATLAQVAQVQVRGRRVDFLGRRWYCRTPRIAPRVIVRLITALPVTSLRLRPVSLSLAMA